MNENEYIRSKCFTYVTLKLLYLDMATYTIQLSNQPIRNSKEYALMLRITVDRAHARMKLIHSVLRSDFNPKTRTGMYVRATHPNNVKINKYLAGVIQDAKVAEEEVERRGKLVTAALIKEEISKPRSSSIFQYLERHIEQLQKRGAIGTYKKYKVILRTLQDYSGYTDLKFGHIDAKFLNDLQEWLLDHGKSQITVHGYLSKIRSVFNKAIGDDVIQLQESPFLTYRIKQGKPVKERLTIDEVDAITKLDLASRGRLNDVRNAFLFSFYTAGMRISDILLLRWKNIQKGRLEYRMHKTGTLLSMDLVPKALEIFNNYMKEKNEREFVFPFLNSRYDLDNPAIIHNQLGAKTALINRYLKDIASLAEIEKKITTHTARHSFADIARKKISNLYDLSKTLGHKDVKTTQSYLAGFDSEVIDDTLEKVY